MTEFFRELPRGQDIEPREAAPGHYHRTSPHLTVLWTPCSDLPTWGVLFSYCFFIAFSGKWMVLVSQTQLCSSSPGSGTFHRAPFPGVWQLKLEPGEERTKELGCFSRGIAASPGNEWLFCWHVAGTSETEVGWPSSASSCLAQWKLHTWGAALGQGGIPGSGCSPVSWPSCPWLSFGCPSWGLKISGERGTYQLLDQVGMSGPAWWPEPRKPLSSSLGHSDHTCIVFCPGWCTFIPPIKNNYCFSSWKKKDA